MRTQNVNVVLSSANFEAARSKSARRTPPTRRPARVPAALPHKVHDITKGRRHPGRGDARY